MPAACCAGPQQWVQPPAQHHHYSHHHQASPGYPLNFPMAHSFMMQPPYQTLYGTQPTAVHQPAYRAALQAPFPAQQQAAYHYNQHHPAALGSYPQMAANPAFGMQQRYGPQLPY